MDLESYSEDDIAVFLQIRPQKLIRLRQHSIITPRQNVPLMSNNFIENFASATLICDKKNRITVCQNMRLPLKTKYIKIRLGGE